MKAVLAALAILLLAIPAPAPVDPDKEVAFRWVDENAAAIRKVSLNIWNNAELALREFKSSRALAATALDLLRNPAFVEAAKKDFAERKKGYAYRLLLLPNRKPPVFTESQR